MPRVTFVASDRGPCGAYRGIFPAEVLAAAGRDVTVQELTDRVLEGRVESDVLVFQRPQHRLLVEAIERLRGQGYRVVVELDDLFEALVPGSPAHLRLDPATNPDNNWEWTRRAVEAADDLVCSTPGIRDAYAKGTVVENCVPAAYLQLESPRPSSGPVRVGWPGDPRFHVGDLDVAVPALASTAGAAFVALGSRATLAQYGLGGDWRAFVPFADYPAALQQLFDVGIAPLADNPFTRAKSWLKALEYAALGIPFVASPSPEYARLGLGLVTNDFSSALKTLASLTRAELRSAGQHLREQVAERGLTYEARADLFWSAWVG